MDILEGRFVNGFSGLPVPADSVRAMVSGAVYKLSELWKTIQARLSPGSAELAERRGWGNRAASLAVGTKQLDHGIDCATGQSVDVDRTFAVRQGDPLDGVVQNFIGQAAQKGYRVRQTPLSVIRSREEHEEGSDRFCGWRSGFKGRVLL
jgi:hypothetical protein